MQLTRQDAGAAGHVQVGLVALSVALNARAGRLDRWRVDLLQTQAEAMLPPGHALRLAALRFAGAWAELRRDPYAMRLLGEELQAALRQALNPEARLAPARHWSEGHGD